MKLRFIKEEGKTDFKGEELFNQLNINNQTRKSWQVILNSEEKNYQL